MRTLFIILLAFIVLAVNAQYTMSKNENYKYIEDVNEAMSGTTAEYKDILIDKDYMYRYYVQANFDSAGDGTNFTILFRGSNDKTNWTTITTVTWGVSSSDTTLVFNNYAETNTISASYAARTDVYKGTHTTASATDYINGKIDGTDSLGTSGVGDYTVDDTLTIAQRVLTRADTVTLGTQTVTTTETITTAKVGWKFLQIHVTGAGSGAGCTLDWMTFAVHRED